jgi:uncharacterized repeat protein (TIGR02543 family)
MVLLLVLLLAGCKNFFHPDKPNTGEPQNDGGEKTQVYFVIGNDFSVAVYSDSARLVKFADVGANGESDPVETAPNNVTFYVSYRLLIDDQEFPYNRELSARIDAETITRVAIPLLSEFDADDLAEPVTTNVYIKIKNTGASSLVLQSGGHDEIPQGAGSSIVNGGETVHYTVNGGPVSHYAFMKNTVTPLAFPDGLTDFVPGHLYSLQFDGNVLTLLADWPITIAQALSILPPEAISAASLANGHISLVWDGTGTETSYVIYRLDPETETYVRIGTADATSYTDSTVAIGNTYYYRISSVVNNVESGKSNTVVSARAAINSLASPQGLSVIGQTVDSINLAWQAVSDATGYKIYKGSSADAISDYVAETASTSYIVTGLAANTSYYFVVSAVHESIESLPSAATQGQTPNQYTVTFDATGGSPAIQTLPIADGASFGSSNMPSAPGRNGYIFNGWYTEANGGGSVFTADTIVTGDVAVYAWWSLDTSIQYTVTFDAAGGSPATQTRMVTNGDSLGASNMPSEPGRTGRIFNGWYTATDGGGSEFTAETIVTGDVAVYAWWSFDTSIQYTVSFDTAEGSPSTRMVTNGSSLGSSMPSEPGKSGYIFNGWYTAANGGGSIFTADTIVTGSMTVYAWWKAQYTVSFDADGGNPTEQTRTVTDGASVGSSNMPPAPDKAGHIFNNWYTAPNGGGSEFNAATMVSGDIRVYARWILDTGIQCTVTFDAAGGSPATQTRTIPNGGSLGSSGMPSEPGRSDYSFNGWYTAADGGGSEFTAGTTVIGNMTVYAWWKMPDDLSLADALTWISNHAVEDDTYTIMLKNNETISPKSLSYGGKKVGITLTGEIMERTIGLSTTGALFTVGSGVTLTLGNNVTLQGRSDNTASLIMVNSGGAFVMNTGSKISGNTSSSYGGGVSVASGTFTMNDGTISGNTSFSSSANHRPSGGGVYVAGGTFTMNDGTISENISISSDSSSSYYSSGGGVSVASGTFTMNDGTISGNTSSSYNLPSGGGVYVAGGTFTMNDGTISGNITTTTTFFSSSSSYGGGVYVAGGTFTMNDGAISDNITTNTTSSYSSSYGGGVYVRSSGTFTMNDGVISDNTSSSSYSSSGGGVYVDSGGTFTMSDGEISGNTASSSYSSSGGGVYVFGMFMMFDGEISGNTAFSSSTSSTSSYGGGVCVGVGGTFTMSGGGEISGNAASATATSAASRSYGGGVCVGGTFTMSGGGISGNTASSSSSSASSIARSYGGGVSVTGGTFAMSSGEISGNTASSSSVSASSSSLGGGVYVSDDGTFTKSGGGIIYGDTDSTVGNGFSTDNTATSTSNPGTSGHAVLYNKDSTNYYYRNETLADDASGNISTTDALPAESGEVLNNWTKR